MNSILPVNPLANLENLRPGAVALPNRVFTIILFSLLLCSRCLAVTLSDNATFEVPFSLEKGHVIVQVKIKKELPVELVIATGVEHSTVDVAQSEKYRLQGGYGREPPVTGPNDRIFFFSVVPDVRVGNAKPTNLIMRVVSLSETSKIVGREIFGILGADFFKGRSVQFDFRNSVLRFLSPANADALTDRKGVKPSTEFTVLHLIESDDNHNKTTLPLCDGIALDGKATTAVLDTGAFLAVGLSSSTAMKLGYTAAANKSVGRKSKIRSVHLGSFVLTDVPLVVSARGTNLDRDLAPHGAVIGIEVLQNFLVTFDFRNRLILLER